MLHILIVAVILVCAIQAVLSKRLLLSALWLAGCSALVALIIYLLGAPQVAVIELSVGAGLVTVLFVFAINIAGEDATGLRSLLPRPVSIGLIVLAVALLGWMTIPGLDKNFQILAEQNFGTTLWQDRGLDVLLQVLLIFSGTLGVLGLLAEGKDEHHTVEGKDA